MYRPLFKNTPLGMACIFPTIIILLIFLYYPVVQSIIISFYRSNLILGTSTFIGFQNYKNLFTGIFAPAFYQALFQTVIFCLAVTFPGLAISVVLAYLANKPFRGASVFRLFLIWPFALSPAVAGTIFLCMFNPEIGIINTVLNFFFHVKPRWLDDPILASLVSICAAIWKNLGYNIVFYLAALQNIPKNLEEAAEIDGARSLRRFFSITLPMLGPTTFFLIFTNITYGFFGAFGLVDILTGGGPIGPPPFDKTGITTVLIYKVFSDGFGGSTNMGLAAAQGVILMIVAIGVTVVQFRSSKDKVYYAGS